MREISQPDERRCRSERSVVNWHRTTVRNTFYANYTEAPWIMKSHFFLNMPIGGLGQPAVPLLQRRYVPLDVLEWVNLLRVCVLKAVIIRFSVKQTERRDLHRDIDIHRRWPVPRNTANGSGHADGTDRFGYGSTKVRQGSLKSEVCIQGRHSMLRFIAKIPLTNTECLFCWAASLFRLFIFHLIPQCRPNWELTGKHHAGKTVTTGLSFQKATPQNLGILTPTQHIL